MNTNESRGTVWLVTIELADTVAAVGSDKATALHWATVKACDYLHHANAYQRNGDKWTPDAVVEYFGYRATETEIDGGGVIH
jgi:hypothetical protein